MKYIISILSSIFLFSCQHATQLENTTWIGDHKCVKITNSNYGELHCDGHLIRKILQFKQDSLIVWHTYTNFINDDEFVNNRSYQERGGEIVTIDSLNIDTYIIKIDQDRLSLIDSSKTSISTYRKLPIYSQAHKRNQFENLVISNIFLVRDTFQFEFDRDNQVITPTLWDEPSIRWDIEVIEGELFLFTRGTFDHILHISEVNESSFVGMTYYKSDQKYYFKKVAKEYRNKDFLFGTWESIQETAPPKEVMLNTESIESDREFYENENLTFTQSGNLVIKNAFNMRNRTFQIDKSSSILYIKLNNSERTEQWNILEMNQVKLTIEKKGILNTLDTISYIRKEE